MAQRLELQAFLVSLLGSGNVYFQPPPTVKMQYPCIIYKRVYLNTDFADNKPYKHKKRYQLTVVDPNPDSDIHEKVAALPMCSYDRFYTADNLNHDVYNLFF
jgi:hypothetical protein